VKPRCGSLQNIAWKICAGAFLWTATSVPAQTVLRQDVATALAGNSAISSRAAAAIDAKEAARRLEKARSTRAQGVKPLPGEQGRSASANELKYAYWQRQERLRLAVELAQRRALMARRRDVPYSVYASAPRI